MLAGAPRRNNLGSGEHQTILGFGETWSSQAASPRTHRACSYWTGEIICSAECRGVWL